MGYRWFNSAAWEAMEGKEGKDCTINGEPKESKRDIPVGGERRARRSHFVTISPLPFTPVFFVICLQETRGEAGENLVSWIERVKRLL